MLISTYDDIVEATIAVARGNIQIDELEFSDYITSKIKIYSNNFQTASELDYRIAKMVLAVQKDFLHTYNFLFNKNITLEQLDKYEFLVVRFIIEDGCIEAIWKIAGKYYKDFIDKHEILKPYLEFFSNMTGKQKIISIMLVLAITGTWKAPEIIRSFRSSPEIKDIMDGNFELVEALSKTQQTTNFFITNIGDGYVEFDGKKYTKEDYKKNKIKKPEKSDIAPIDVADTFFIQKYDFDKQLVLIFAAGNESFWASTEWLTEDARERLKRVTAEAIDKKTIGKETMLVACKIRDKRMAEAQVLRLGIELDGKVITFDQLFENTRISLRPSHFQGGLLDEN